MQRFIGAVALVAAVGLIACSDTTEPGFQAFQDGGPTPEVNEDVVASLGRTAWMTSGATVYVGHGINGSDLGLDEALPVDISVNGACALEGFEFRTFAGPLNLPAGDYEVAVSPANAGSPCGNSPVIGPVTVTVSNGDNATIFAHLTDAGVPTASVFVNEFGRYGRSQFAARHAADFSAVDVVIDGGKRREVRVPDLANGHQASGPIQPGRHTVALEPAGSGTPVFETSLVLRPFTAYYAYAVGTPSNGTFEVLLQTVTAPRPGYAWGQGSRADRDED